MTSVSSSFWKFMMCHSMNLFSSIVWVLSRHYQIVFQFWEISLNLMMSLFVWFVFPGLSFWNSYYLEVGPLGLVLYSYFLSSIFHHFNFQLYYLDFFSTLFSNLSIEIFIFTVLHFQEFFLTIWMVFFG